MKKLLLMICLAICVNASGQDYSKSGIFFYGVDFSLAKVYGATETYAQFRKAFIDINSLFIIEAKKYDVGKILYTDVIDMNMEAVDYRNKRINQDELFTTMNNYRVTNEAIEELVKTLELQEENGTGLVVVAGLLDKLDSRATYSVVYFDIATREILDILDTNGKARGFGLRNYWAHSLLSALKKL